MTIYSPRKKKTRTVVGFFVLALFITTVAGLTAMAFSLLKDLPDPSRITERAISESTKIYDRSGEVVLFEIHGEEKRTIVSIQEIPASVKWATIMAEDNDFYHHIGIDWRGVLRALLKNVLGGGITQGGSTITQQVVKNSLLGWSKRKFVNKVREQILALLLERKYSKDEILEFYLNQVPYGSNAYGVASAAQTFFAKDVKDLTLNEAALIAALPKAPTRYSPYGSNKEELFARKNWILTRMAEAGYAEKVEVEKAKSAQLSFAPPRQTIRAPHFVMYVREYLNEKFGEEFVEQGGLKVITSLDWELQQEAEKVVREGTKRNEELVQAANASLVAINPGNGEILAMVGSRDYWGDPIPKGCHPGINCRFDPHVNVTIRKRQPGSAFKPFIYATAFKKGYTPETVLLDVPTEFNTGCNPDGTPGPLVVDEKQCYHPRNYDGKFRGPVTLRQALAQSLNVPSVKLLYLAGVNDSIATAKSTGITTLVEPDRYGLSLVLGGAEVTLLEMTSAFGAFAKDGVLHPKTSILRVENSKGLILEEKKDLSLAVVDTEVARTINDILSDNQARIPIFSPQSSLYFSDRKVAAKTGTTQDFRDAWVVGYTPSLVAGVWVGNNDNTPMNQSALSIMVAGPIWHNFLASALKNLPPEEFPKPSPVIVEKMVLRGIYRLGPIVKIDKISGKRATEFTPPELIEEVALGNISTILTHLKKEDPLGDAPLDPIQEPQFKNWQAGIELWLAQNNLPLPFISDEYDDLHLPEKRPKITLPQLESGNIATFPKEISVKVQRFFPLREISLFIDDALIDSKTAPLLTEIIYFKLEETLPYGQHLIKITAYDAVGNSSIYEKSFRVTNADESR